MNISKQVRLGIFVSMGLFAFIFALFYVGSRQNLFERTFRLECVFQNVSGLRKGANVWFSGVKIGIVQGIIINPDASVTIEMKLEEKVRPYIKKDGKASIGSDGLIGDRIVVLSSGTMAAGEVNHGYTIEAEEQVKTDDMMKTLSQTNDNILSLTSDFKTILGQITSGKGNIGKLFQDSTLFRDLSQTMAQASVASTRLSAAGTSLNNMINELQHGDGLIASLMSDTSLTTNIKQTLSDLQSTGGELKAATTEFSELAANLKGVSQGLERGEGTLGMMLQDKEFANSLKETMENLNASTEKLDENMVALRQNFLFKKYFKKQAKKQGEK